MRVPRFITVAPGWYVGGTLLDATIKEWHQAKWQNGLATCSLWIRAAAARHNQPVTSDTGEVIGVNKSTIDFTTGDLLDYSAGLLRALVEGTSKESANPDLKVSELAVLTLKNLGWLQVKSTEFIEA